MPVSALVPAPTTPASSEEFAPSEQAILQCYVSNLDQSVFAIRNLPEEVTAVLFAMYSRSPGTLRRNLLTLLRQTDLAALSPASSDPHLSRTLTVAAHKAAAFHEKWVLGYGHASVAEHAVVHLAAENISILLSKILEDARLASFTEKSTRFVIFDRTKFYREPQLMASPDAALYDDTCTLLLDTYSHLMDPVITAVRQDVPQRSDQTNHTYQTITKAKACDLLRLLLPASTLTNVGATFNARALEHVITKLLSHPLAEAQALGNAFKTEAQLLIPTLLKYAEINPYRRDTPPALQTRARGLFADATSPAAISPVTLVHAPPDAEDRLVAAILYGYTDLPYLDIQNHIATLSTPDKHAIVDDYLARRGPHDQPLRALEHLTYTFDILVDFGAFRDIQRHRMATQTPQESTALHGYTVPEDLIRYGFGESFERCMHRARSAYNLLSSTHPHEAPYVLPLAFRKRVLFTWNLREIHHFVQLRSGKQGHPSYRRIAQQVFREIERIHPLLARYIRVDLQDYRLARG